MSKNRKLSEEEASLRDKQIGMIRTCAYLNCYDKHTYLCSFCNKEFLTKPMDVWLGRSKGHLKCSRKNYRGAKNPRFNGFKEITGLFWRGIKGNAKVRNLTLDVSKEDLYNKLIEQNHKCYYTNLDIYISQFNSDKETTASVDRLDSNKGYTKDNIVWCHKKVNIMKMNLTVEEFVEFCRLITLNFKKKDDK